MAWRIACADYTGRMTATRQQLDGAALAARIKRWGLALGFQQVGITAASLPQAEARLQTWLAEGRHGAMDYMQRHGSKRSRPAELVPETRSVISVRLDYLPRESRDPKTLLDDGATAFVSRYALGRDYHKLMRNRLQKLA